jgi:hypothetical protein
MGSRCRLVQMFIVDVGSLDAEEQGCTHFMVGR